MLKLVLCFCLLSVVTGFLFGNSGKWNGLKVTWGLNPFNKNTFSTLPRTVSDATKAGFKKISSNCAGLFLGNRYVKNGDHAVVLMFDNPGYIAGIQVGVPKGQKNGYPFAREQPPFLAEGNYYYMTAYFVNPSIICTTGRSSANFKSQGTGTDLYIQNGTNPIKNVVRISHKPTDLFYTKWTEGKCFPTMGLHYWYNLSKDMDCKTIFPVFLLYNGGKLNGFGWAMTTPLTSSRYEHPKPSNLAAFIKEVPKCLERIGPMSTMHIYFTSNPVLDLC